MDTLLYPSLAPPLIPICLLLYHFPLFPMLVLLCRLKDVVVWLSQAILQAEKF